MKWKLRFFVLIAVCALSSPKLHALTAQQIDNEVRLYLKDNATNTTRQQFTDTTILNFINDGQREANAIGWLLQSSYTFTLVGGTTYYNLPSDFMAPQRVLFNNVKLDATSLNQLDASAAGWVSSNGQPINYYIYSANPSQMGFYPVPTTTSTGTVILFYIQQPVELTSLTQTPFNGWPILTPYHSALIYYVTYRCYLTLEEQELGTPYYNEWINFLTFMKTGVMKQPDFNPGFQGRRNQ